jgi:uncharacterized protein YraI
VSIFAHPAISEYYQHLSDITVGQGQTVNAGDLIGYSGGQIGYGDHPATCCSGGPHLEWGINAPYGGMWHPLGANIDPVPYLRSLLNGGNPGPGCSGAGCYYTIAATSLYGGPGTDQGLVGALPADAAVDILCQTHGGTVGNSSIWDMISGQAHNGSDRYVPDYYVDTPNDGTFTPGLPPCVVPPPPPPPPPLYYVHHVYGTCADGACGLHERSGPGYSNYPITGMLYDGDQVDIVCQTRGEFLQPNHGVGSGIWDELTNGSYVTDVYIDTSGTGGNFSPPIPQC